MRKCFVYALAFAVMLVVSAGRASAQNAQITGTVTDDSGGVVPGVTMTARNEETGLVRTAVTDATGNYRLPALPPGIYVVIVELQGFNTEERKDIVLVIDPGMAFGTAEHGTTRGCLRLLERNFFLTIIMRDSSGFFSRHLCSA